MQLPAHWRIAAGGVVGAAVALIIGLTMLPRSYISASSIIFPVRSGGSALEDLSLTALGNLAQPAGSDFPLATFEAVLNSERAAMNVARTVGVQQLWQLKDDEDVRQFMNEALSSKVNNIDRSMIISAKVEGTPMVRSLGDLFDRAAADQRDERYRQAAKEMVEALTAEMDSIANDMMLDRTRARLEGVEDQLAVEQAKFDKLRQRLTELQRRHATPDVASKAQLLGSQAAEWRAQIDYLEAEIANKRSSLTTLGRQVAWQLDHLSELPAEDPLLQAARAKYREARRRFQEASKLYGSESPEVLRSAQDLRLAEEALREEADAARKQGTPEMQALRVSLAGLERQRSELVRGWLQREAEIRELPSAAAELTMAIAEVEQQAKVIATLRANQTSAELDYISNGVRWSVLDAPRVPVRKAGPRLSFLMVAGALLGAVVLAPFAWRDLLRRLSEQLAKADRTGPADAA